MKKLFALLLLFPFIASAVVLTPAQVSQYYAEQSIAQTPLLPTEWLASKEKKERTERPRVDVRQLAVSPSEYYLLAQPQNGLLGVQNAVGGRVYTLSGSGVSSSATSLGLSSFKVAGADIKLGMTDFGDKGCGTIEPGNASRQEFISFTGVTQNSDGTATLTGVTRGLSPVSPFTASTTQQKAHSGSTQFVISNSPPCFYENIPNLGSNNLFTGINQFSTAPISTGADATSTDQFVTLGELNSVSVTGAATATPTVIGISALSNLGDTANGTASTTSGAPKVIPNSRATSSPQTLAGYIPATDSTGKVPAAFIATSSQYNFTGTFGFSSSTPAVTSGVGIQGSLYVSGTTTITNVALASSSNPSAEQVFTNNGLGQGYWSNKATTTIAIVPLPAWSRSTTTAIEFGQATNTQGLWGAFVLPFRIVLNRITFFVRSVATAGSVVIGIYSEDGQTRFVNQTKTVGAIATAQATSTTLSSAVTLEPGVYYFGMITTGTTNISLVGQVCESYSNSIALNISGEPVLCGITSESAGTLPTTLNTSTISTTTQSVAMPSLRLDN